MESSPSLMYTPQPPHRAALAVCLVAAFALLIGIGPIVGSRIGHTSDANANELSAADTSEAPSTTSPPTTVAPVPTAAEIAAAAPSTTSPPATSTTVAPPPPPPAPEPEPEPEPEPAPEPEPVAASSGYAARTDIPDSYWDRMAQCETSGNWGHYPGARWSGGLGIYTPGWIQFGGGEFAPSAGEATREQQIVVANRIAAVGLGGWGCLSRVGYP